VINNSNSKNKTANSSLLRMWLVRMAIGVKTKQMQKKHQSVTRENFVNFWLCFGRVEELLNTTIKKRNVKQVASFSFLYLTEQTNRSAYSSFLHLTEQEIEDRDMKRNFDLMCIFSNFE